MNEALYAISIWALPIIFAITLHEAAHGFVAWRLGDSTARDLGRVTANPIKHIDPLGTIILPLLLYLSPAPFLFGYAKPVPVNYRNLRKPRRDSAIVAFAGPASNLLLALGLGAPDPRGHSSSGQHRRVAGRRISPTRFGSIWFWLCSTCCRCRRWMAGASRWACCRAAWPYRWRGLNVTGCSS